MSTVLASLSPPGLIKVAPGLMIWTLIAFAITFFVLEKYAFGPIEKTIDDRRDRIQQAIDEAHNARNEARALLEQHRALIAEARIVSPPTILGARPQGRRRPDRPGEGGGRAERLRRIEETRKQIDAETARAIDQIRGEVADLTVQATQRVVGKVLDGADQRRLIDEAIAGLDFSSLERGRN